jgi:O-antigen/teichoic acid export membrane protein
LEDDGTTNTEESLTGMEASETSDAPVVVKRKDGIFDEGFLVIIIGLGNVFNFYFHIYMSRNLGPDGYSALNSLMSLLFWINIPVVTIQTTITKFVAEFTARNEDARVRRLFLECLKRVGIGAFVLMSLIIFASPFIGEFLNIEARTPIVVSGLLLFVMNLMPVFWAVMQGRERFGVLGLSYFTNFVSKCALGILFAIIGWGVGGVLLGVVFSFGFAFIAGCMPILEVLRERGDDDHVEMQAIYRFALPVVATLLCLYSFCNLDIPLVRHFYGDSEEGLQLAGYYATASIIGKGFLFLPLGIILALFPKVARQKAVGENPVPVLLRGLGIEIVLSVGGIVVCIVMAPFLAMLLGKTDAPVLVTLIRVFGIAITPVALTMILAHYNLALERYGFIWMLLPLTIMTFVGICLFHPTLISVLAVIGSGSFIVALLISAFTIVSHKRSPS